MLWKMLRVRKYDIKGIMGHYSLMQVAAVLLFD